MKLTLWIYILNMAVDIAIILARISEHKELGGWPIAASAWLCACISESQLIQKRK